MNYSINTRKILKLFILITIGLTAAHVFSQIMLYSIDNAIVKKISDLFNLDAEKNFPTFFSTFLLLTSSFLLLVISLIKSSDKKIKYYWAGLSAFFLFLSMDEFIEIHERIGNTISNYYHTSGMLIFPWVIPYIIIIIILIIIYLKFFLKLPSQTKIQFTVAFIVYIFGALIMEFVGAKFYSAAGQNKTMLFNISSTLEEILEMSGVILFINALFNYLILIGGSSLLQIFINKKLK